MSPRHSQVGRLYEYFYAISPKPPSNAKGSDFAGILFYEWNIDFPTTGEYTIKGARDNKGQLYIDNEFVMELDGFKGAINPVKKFLWARDKNIRLDLSIFHSMKRLR